MRQLTKMAPSTLAKQSFQIKRKKQSLEMEVWRQSHPILFKKTIYLALYCSAIFFPNDLGA